MPYFDDPDEEIDVYTRLETRRKQQATYYRNATQDLAELIGANRQNYPWMKPGVVLPLAKAGVTPDRAVAKVAAEKSAKKKSKDGFGWHSIGDAVNAVGRGAKGAARVAATAAQAPIEGVQGQFRNFLSGNFSSPGLAGLPIDVSQTTAGVAVEKAIHGEEVDTGSGFFVNPESGVGQEQIRRAREAGSITWTDENGVEQRSAITPGRWVANMVSEPGTSSYNVLSGLVDASVAVADPTAIGLGKTSKLRQSRQLLTVQSPTRLRAAAEAAGLVKGVRPAVISEVADQWLHGADGRKVVDFIAGEADWDKLWKTFNKKMPVELVTELADARDAEAVRNILRPVLGVELREKPYVANPLTRKIKPVGGYGVEIRRRMDGIRLLGTMPGSHLDLNDADGAVEQLDRFQKNAKLPAEIIARNNERLARATSRPEKFQVVADTAREIAASTGLPPNKARRLTTLFENYDREYAKYFVDEIGENVHVPGAVIDGAGKALPTPHLYVEYINGVVPLPDAREIKRATSTIGKLWDIPGFEPTASLLDGAMQNVWKPLTLLRGAWTVRVVSEEQVRMAGAGLDSVFAHPISAVARIVGERGKTGITGELLADAEQAQKALSRGSMGFRDRGVVTTKFKTLVEKGDDGYARAWGDELAQLAADPVAKRIAASTPDEVKDAFWDGDLSWARKDMGEARAELLERATADAYVDSVYRRIQIKTGEDHDLINALATGRLGDEAISDGQRLNRKFLRQLEAKDSGPVKVKGDLTVAVKNKTEAYDRAVEWGFNTLMSKPTNFLSRSKAFEQFYWKRAEELVAHLATDAQDELLQNAVKAKLPKDQIRRLREVAKRSSGEVDLKRADMVAKDFALNSTKDLLYDLSEKSQWADAMRLIFPFGEAWKEILTRWARIGYENPKVLRRGQQLIQGARGSGFFYTSEQSGEEVFAYPGSKFINEKLVGVPLPVEGAVSGLNLFSQSVLPGVGPVVQFPAAAFLPDKPEWDEVRKLILPYGEPTGAFPQSLLPAWAKKLQTGFNAPESDRLFNNTVMDVAAYLMSTGDYSTDSEENIDKLLSDAKKKAKAIYIIRGIAQFGAPTAPQPLEVVQDKDGHIHAIRTLSNEFHEREEAIGYQEAVAEFLEKYGDNAALILQGRTEGGGPPTSEGYDFVREHPEIARKYPEVYGYFLPAGGEIDFTAYERQIASGERKPLEKKEVIYRSNARLANAILATAKSKLSEKPTKAEREWLSAVRAALVEEYPGFEPTPVDMGKTPRKVRALIELADDPAVKGTDAAEGLDLYLLARKKAQAAAEELGLKSSSTGPAFARAKRAAQIREWLRNVGEAIAEEHPDFAPMWEQVFDREMAKEEAA